MFGVTVTGVSTTSVKVRVKVASLVDAFLACHEGKIA